MTTRTTGLVGFLSVVLRIGRAAGIVAAAGLSFWLLVSPLVMSGDEPRGSVSVPVAVGEGSILPVVRLAVAEDDGRFASPALVDGRGELRLRTALWGLQFVTNLGWLISIAVVVWVVHLLIAFLDAVRRGEPFDAGNRVRLTRIGWILVAAGVVVPIAEFVASSAVLSRVTVEGLPLSPLFEVNGDAIVAGLLVLVLAAIFGHGAELERDRSLTV